jgi:hypothetical protein
VHCILIAAPRAGNPASASPLTQLHDSRRRHSKCCHCRHQLAARLLKQGHLVARLQVQIPHDGAGKAGGLPAAKGKEGEAWRVLRGVRAGVLAGGGGGASGGERPGCAPRSGGWRPIVHLSWKPRSPSKSCTAAAAAWEGVAVAAIVRRGVLAAGAPRAIRACIALL